MRRNPRQSAALVVALVALVGVQLLAGSPATAAAVPNSAQAAYHGGTTSAPSAPVEGYAGELLTLQAANIGTTASEPTLGVAADGTAYFAGATLLVERGDVYGVAQTHTMRSTDGGLTWSRIQFGIPAADVSVPPGNLDPFVWVDQTTGRVFNIDLYGGCSWLNYSDDRGETWIPNPLACGMPVNDHQTIGGGAPRGGLSTTGYPNVLYYCANQVLQTGCGRSLDGGLVWTPTETHPFPPAFDESGCGRLTGHLETDPEGRLFLPNGGGCNDGAWVAISEDSGQTWARVQVNELDSAVNHTSVAADAAGNLYYMTLAKLGTDASPRYLPFLNVSRDHGRTWGPSVMVAPPGISHANFPVIAAGDEGRIAINFPATTSVLTGTKNAKWNQYVVISVDALSENPVFLSATGNDPADPVHRGACIGRCGGMWDFLDVVVSPAGDAWASAADDCTGTCASPGNLNFQHVGDGIAIRQIGGPKLRG